jgi:hypothetical protein
MYKWFMDKRWKKITIANDVLRSQIFPLRALYPTIIQHNEILL